ncbi:MAG: glycoside hydrolase, partial [Candidatus Bipolaricaulia bacterium]
MVNTNKDVFFIPHTHWDREWYMTFQQFRYRLTKLIDKLIEGQVNDPAFRHFMLDGQVVVIEDYLEVNQGKKSVLESLIQEGKLQIGPWYTLPDTFLVNGESLIRNLLIGHREAQELGGVMKQGWVPDPFGLTAQLPQILQGFGIDNAFMMRGVGKKAKSTDFEWESPDGSKVTAHYLRAGYGSINRLASTTDETEVAEWASSYLQTSSGVNVTNLLTLLEFLDGRTLSSAIMIPVGGDHLEIQKD